MHLGFSVSMVGDISNPHSQKGDLLIIGSGSGETDSLVALANKAKKRHVSIALITLDSQSTIAKLSDVIVTLPGVSPKLINAGLEIKSIQPMGSAFEQMTFLTYDGIILELMEKLQQNSDVRTAR
jgi:6-phospho-3-hexuloisomerase